MDYSKKALCKEKDDHAKDYIWVTSLIENSRKGKQGDRRQTERRLGAKLRSTDGLERTREKFLGVLEMF